MSLRPEANAVVSRYDAKDKSPRAIFVETDVTSWPALDKMFDVAYTEFGDVHVVCPGAGVYEPCWSSFWCPPGSKLSRDANHYALLDINLTHPIRATQIAISRWMHPRDTRASAFPTPARVSPSNPRRIVHVASVAAQWPSVLTPLYNASKAGLCGFVRSLAPMEDEYGIRVNAVAPGIVRTPIWTEDKLANVDESVDAWIPSERTAAAMLDCVEGGSRVGGTVVEVGVGHIREVGICNDPGPPLHPGSGMFISNTEVGKLEVDNLLGDSSMWGEPPKDYE